MDERTRNPNEPPDGTTSSQLVRVNVPRVFIAGASRGAGTSTIVLGLLVALKREKTSVAAAVVGSRVIQATQYRRVSGRLCHSLNLWMLSPEQMLHSVARLSSGAEMILIEGELGLFDRYENDCSFETEAELAKHVAAPIIVILDAKHYRETLGAVLHGLSTYRPECRPIGVICNRVQSADQQSRLKAALEEVEGITFLGAIPEEPSLEGADQIDESGNPSLLNRNLVVAAGEIVGKHVDLGLLRELAAESEPFPVKKSILSTRSRACRIAVAEDMAFHLTYQSNLDLIRRAGAELVAFSPLLDRKLPERIQAIYLPSGYVDLYAGELSENMAMREALEKFVRSGGVLYAEGNSIAYLCRNLALSSGIRHGVASIIPGQATLLPDRAETSRSADFRVGDPAQFVELSFLTRTILSLEDDVARGMRDYRWVIRPEERVLSAVEMKTRESLLAANPDEQVHVIEGLCPFPNVLITSAMMHWGSNPKLASNLVDAALAAGATLP